MLQEMIQIHVGPDLTVGQYETTDAPELCELITRNRAHLAHRFTWAQRCVTSADSESFIAHAAYVAETNGAPTWAVRYDGRLIGTVSLHPIDHANGSALAGYWIDADMQGRGITVAAMRALIEYGFISLNLRRVVIVCSPDNAASHAVARKLGFVQQGPLLPASWAKDDTTTLMNTFIKLPN